MRHSPVPALALLLAIGLAAPALADGKALYDANCAKCHGPDGKADTPVGKAMKAASLARDWSAEGGADHVVQHVREDGKHTPVSGKLSDEDLQAIAQYVITFGSEG
jgi:mono/diheme cytochrome c family protein